jgi:SAM-dependent methyltransferase
VASALGWQVAGVEVDEAAAAKARRFGGRVHAGDLLEAPFAPAEFDLITALHVLEHVPDPVAAVRRMLGWLAPGGLLVVEVPNAGGLGARLFGRAWSGLELPRHLSHFTPATLEQVVTRAGEWRGAGIRPSPATTCGASGTGSVTAAGRDWPASRSGAPRTVS